MDNLLALAGGAKGALIGRLSSQIGRLSPHNFDSAASASPFSRNGQRSPPTAGQAALSKHQRSRLLRRAPKTCFCASQGGDGISRRINAASHNAAGLWPAAARSSQGSYRAAGGFAKVTEATARFVRSAGQGRADCGAPWPNTIVP